MDRQRDQENGDARPPSRISPEQNEEEHRGKQHEGRAFLLDRHAEERRRRQAPEAFGRSDLENVEQRTAHENERERQRHFGRPHVQGPVEREAQRGQRRGPGACRARDAASEKPGERQQRRELAGRPEQGEGLVVPRAHEPRKGRQRKRHEQRILRMRPGERRIQEEPLLERRRKGRELALQAPDRQVVRRPHRLGDGLYEEQGPGHGRHGRKHGDGARIARIHSARGTIEAGPAKDEARADDERVAEQDSPRAGPACPEAPADEDRALREESERKAPRRALHAGQASADQPQERPAHHPGRGESKGHPQERNRNGHRRQRVPCAIGSPFGAGSVR